jgi:hypothetical protein
LPQAPAWGESNSKGFRFQMDTQHIADVGDKIISGPGAKVEDLKPSLDLIRRGQDALEQLRANKTFDSWASVTTALATLQLMAMREAGTNSPQGPRYRAASRTKWPTGEVRSPCLELEYRGAVPAFSRAGRRLPIDE